MTKKHIIMSNEDTELDLELDAIVDDDQGTDDQDKPVDWEAVAKRYKKKLNNVKSKSAEKPQMDTSAVDSKLARLELKVDGYSDEAIDFIIKNGGRDALQNQYVKTAIDSIQEQKRAENAVISNDNVKSDIERKYSPGEIDDMSVEALEKILPKAVK